MIATQDYDAA